MFEALCYIVGLLMGWVLCCIFLRSKPAGCIHVDETNLEKDLYTFEFYIPPYELNEQKFVIFEIRRKNT